MLIKREWRCKKCAVLLDVGREAWLHLRYKQAHYVRYRPEDLGPWTAETKAQSVTHQGVV